MILPTDHHNEAMKAVLHLDQRENGGKLGNLEVGVDRDGEGMLQREGMLPATAEDRESLKVGLGSIEDSEHLLARGIKAVPLIAEQGATSRGGPEAE